MYCVVIVAFCALLFSNSCSKSEKLETNNPNQGQTPNSPQFTLPNFDFDYSDIPVTESKVTLNEAEAKFTQTLFGKAESHDQDAFAQGVLDLKGAQTESEIKQSLSRMLSSAGSQRDSNSLIVALAHAYRLATGQPYFRKPTEEDKEEIIDGLYGPSIVPPEYDNSSGRIKKNYELQGFKWFAKDFHLDSAFKDEQGLSFHQYFVNLKYFDDFISDFQDSEDGSIYFVYLTPSKQGSLAIKFRGHVFHIESALSVGLDILTTQEFLTRNYSNDYPLKEHIRAGGGTIAYSKTRLKIHPWFSIRE